MLLCAITLSTGCHGAAARSGASESTRLGQADAPRVCQTPRGGLVISLQRVALFPTRATIAELDRLCSAGERVLYDAVGWQAPAQAFPFLGARITAVLSQTTHDTLHSPGVPDLWIAEGDSLRLEDGQLIPRTLGELRSRYGRALADGNVDAGADDFDGFGTLSCRFPYLRFKLAFGGHGIIPDSTHIIGLEMWVPAPSGVEHICRR